jgi:orotidine-5'-phosphate decarboxylase
MANRDFNQLLKAQEAQGKFLCVGLDPDYEKIPESARKGDMRKTLVAFNRAVVDATKDIVGAIKVNPAFYESHGDEGWSALRETIFYAHEQAPDVPIIFDGKRADIGNSNVGYATSAFDHLRADAVTVHPYLGSEALQAFLERKEKGVIVLCRTSNSGAGEFQDMEIKGEPLYMHVARHVQEKWNVNGNCGLVVGATYPEEIKAVRKIADDLFLLIPGIGAQGGDLEKAVAAAKDSRGGGFIIVISRAIIYASSAPDYMDAMRAKAQEFDSAIRKAL